MEDPSHGICLHEARQGLPAFLRDLSFEKLRMAHIRQDVPGELRAVQGFDPILLLQGGQPELEPLGLVLHVLLESVCMKSTPLVIRVSEGSKVELGNQGV